MAILDICTYPDPVLSKVCEPVAVIDDKLLVLARDMAETMYAAPGVGLAAPQVGQALQLIVVDTKPEAERGDPMVLFNPRVVEEEGEETAEEGCLSLPDHFSQVTRASRVVVEAMDQEGKPVRIRAQGMLARCLQHEIDHLQGRLLLDYVSPLKRALYRKRCQKQRARA